MNIFNFSNLLHKIASCHDGNMYINNNLVFACLNYVDPPKLGDIYTTIMWDMKRDFLQQFIQYNVWQHIPFRIMFNLEIKSNRLPFTIQYSALPIFVKFTHIDKSNCRKYFKDISRNIYCQYEEELNYYICSKDGELSHIANKIQEIK